MTESKIIFEALDEEKSATASDLAIKTGLSVKKVSAALHHLISSGKVYHIGERPISASREVNLYSTRKREPEVIRVTRQTWYSPLMQ